MACQGQLAYEIASRPLFAENLDAEVGVIIARPCEWVVIARSGDFGAAWRKIDAVNLFVDPPAVWKAQNFLPRLCADEMDVAIDVPSRDDVAGGPVLHALNFHVKARRPASVVGSCRTTVVPQVPQDQIHHVALAVEQFVQARAEGDTHAVAVPGCTARSAVAHARRRVAGHGVEHRGDGPLELCRGRLLPALQVGKALPAGRQPLLEPAQLLAQLLASRPRRRLLGLLPSRSTRSAACVRASASTRPCAGGARSASSGRTTPANTCTRLLPLSATTRPPACAPAAPFCGALPMVASQLRHLHPLSQRLGGGKGSEPHQTLCGAAFVCRRGICVFSPLPLFPFF